MSLLLAAVLASCDSAPEPFGESERLDLAAFASCDECQLELEPTLLLGEARGDGIVESVSARVTYGAGPEVFALYQTGASHLLLFDKQGDFIRRLGGAGQGPGELGYVWRVEFIGDQLGILDLASGIVRVLDLNGHHQRDVRLPSRPSSFRPWSDLTLLLGWLSNEGRPLLERLSQDELEALSGLVEDGNQVDSYPTMLGLSADSRKMWVRNQSDPFVLRHWVPGRSDWAGEIAAQFQWQESAAELLGPQASGLIDFGVDAEDRLWLLHRLPRDGWRWDDVPPTPSGERLITIEQMGEYFVTRLDVFDLEGRRHEGTATLESGTAKLLMIAGRMLVHTVELDEFIVPRAVLHEIRVPR